MCVTFGKHLHSVVHNKEGWQLHCDLRVCMCSINLWIVMVCWYLWIPWIQRYQQIHCCEVLLSLWQQRTEKSKDLSFQINNIKIWGLFSHLNLKVWFPLLHFLWLWHDNIVHTSIYWWPKPVFKLCGKYFLTFLKPK